MTSSIQTRGCFGVNREIFMTRLVQFAQGYKININIAFGQLARIQKCLKLDLKATKRSLFSNTSFVIG